MLWTGVRTVRAGDLMHTKAGRCLVCGRRTLFLVTDPKRVRENAWCVWCGSCSRNRHVARCIVEALREYHLRSARELAALASVRLYSMSASGCFARVWGPRPHITYSEYFEDWEGGTYRDSVLCQNVERLTFADGSFDLIVSEDVFEHVRDCRRGFREIRRVLKPGGCHVFSVPIGFTHPTQERFETRGDQEVPRLPVEYHGDPIRGQIPVRTTFGYDLVDFLESLGFEASLEMSRYDETRRFGTFDCVTVVTRKP